MKSSKWFFFLSQFSTSSFTQHILYTMVMTMSLKEDPNVVSLFELLTAFTHLSQCVLIYIFTLLVAFCLLLLHYQQKKRWFLVHVSFSIFIVVGKMSDALRNARCNISLCLSQKHRHDRRSHLHMSFVIVIALQHHIFYGCRTSQKKKLIDDRCNFCLLMQVSRALVAF